MSGITREKVSKSVRDMFDRGFSAFERGNLDYAIEMLFSCVQASPEFIQARKYLRVAEIQRFKKKKSNSIAEAILNTKNMPSYLKAVAQVKAGKFDQAMMSIEKTFLTDPLNAKYAKVFAEAAVGQNLPDVATQTLEVARDQNPNNIEILNWLGSLYQKMGRTSSARECFEQLCELAPNDPDVLKLLKDSTAIDSMNSDGWQETAESGGSFRTMIKDSDEATLLEQEKKAVKSDKDIDALITDTIAKIENDPKNINYYRALAKLYTQKDSYEKAVEVLEKAIVMNPGDPELDNTMSTTRINWFDFQIKKAREAGDSEEELTRLMTEREQFVFDDLQERIARYPNDPELRFKWGVKLFENDYINEAIQQFQIAQRNPKLRTKSLYYMAMCFKSKGQKDMAVEQLKTAASELYSMDETKMDILYELGGILSESGDYDNAAEYYKQIYQCDIGYKDISEKVEQVYQKRTAQNQ